MLNLEDYKKDFFLFLEAGFIAINQADEDSSIKLLKAAELLDPKNSLVKIGKGYLHLHKLELNKAIEIFEQIIKNEPDNVMAKTFLGIALSWTPNDTLKGEKLLEETKKTDDKQIKELSTSALEFVDNFIKKEPGPVEGNRKK